MRTSCAGMLVALALLATACGGDDSDEDAATPAATESSSDGDDSSESSATPSGDSDDDDAPASAPGEAVATANVGDTSWTFALSGDSRELCDSNANGIFFVNLFGEDEDGQEVAFTINAPPGGPAVVRVGGTTIDRQYWIADEDVYFRYPELPAGIGVDIEIDGNSASGTATYYEDRAMSQSTQTGGSYEAGLFEGSFEVTCPSN